eukprot:3027896-Prymnesium_polylepis.1
MMTEVGCTSHAAVRPCRDSATRFVHQPRSTAGCTNPCDELPSCVDACISSRCIRLRRSAQRRRQHVAAS